MFGIRVVILLVWIVLPLIMFGYIMGKNDQVKKGIKQLSRPIMVK